MQGTQSINATACVPWLNGTALNVYTQFGEDGLIDAVFGRIGTTNRECFEVGAADGRFYSNTLRLREDGWGAVLMEKDPEQWTLLNANYRTDLVDCIVGAVDDLDTTLHWTRLRDELQPDLGVIDIDGQDYWLWNDMVEYRPRVMLVEINYHEWDAVPPRGEIGQAGLAAIRQLGADKGYELVAHTYCNALFIRQDELV